MLADTKPVIAPLDQDAWIAKPEQHFRSPLSFFRNLLGGGNRILFKSDRSLG
jgi:hypothetical protein